MIEDIQNFSPTVIFRGTPSSILFQFVILLDVNKLKFKGSVREK